MINLKVNDNKAHKMPQVTSSYPKLWNMLLCLRWGNKLWVTEHN